MIVLIDNYDSFTYNVYHYLIECGAEVEVHRNDALTVAELDAKNPEGIVISPGPCTPNEAGICMDVIKDLGGHIPILGICLGFQATGQVFGGNVVRGEQPVHAKIHTITHTGTSGFFKDIPTSFKATRYHSLIVDNDTAPDCLTITARSDDGVIQAFEHAEHPIYGVQFHPESFATEHGHKMIQNFLDICATHKKG